MVSENGHYPDLHNREKSGFTGPQRICAVGVGSAGICIVNSLFYLDVKCVKTIAIDTDRACIDVIRADKRVLIGKSLTNGLGTQGNPEMGKRAAEMALPTLESLLEGFDLVFIAAGLGGGTGTGAAPVIASIAHDNGAIVVGLVTYPFHIEQARLKKADEGREVLRTAVDSMIVFDNNRMSPPGQMCCFGDVFSISRHSVIETIKCISETIMEPALVDIDFADIRAIMSKGRGTVLLYGESRLSTPPGDIVRICRDHTVNDIDLRNGSGCLILFIGGSDITLINAEEIAGLFSADLSLDADVIWGGRIDVRYEGRMRVLAIVTGIDPPQ